MENTRRGSEHPSKTPGKTHISGVGGAESGALGAPNPPFDPELGRIIKAWPDLPTGVRVGIMAMVRASEGKG